VEYSLVDGLLTRGLLRRGGSSETNEALSLQVGIQKNRSALLAEASHPVQVTEGEHGDSADELQEFDIEQVVIILMGLDLILDRHLRVDEGLLQLLRRYLVVGLATLVGFEGRFHKLLGGGKVEGFGTFRALVLLVNVAEALLVVVEQLIQNFTATNGRSLVALKGIVVVLLENSVHEQAQVAADLLTFRLEHLVTASHESLKQLTPAEGAAEALYGVIPGGTDEDNLHLILRQVAWQ